LDYFKAKPGEVIESDSRTDDFDKNFENSNYTMIDFSDFSSIGDDAF
jgi:hypothetical protein